MDSWYSRFEQTTTESHCKRPQARTDAQELAQQFDISKSTVTKFLKRWKIQGDYIKKKRSGRPHCCRSQHSSHISQRSTFHGIQYCEDNIDSWITLPTIKRPQTPDP